MGRKENVIKTFMIFIAVILFVFCFSYVAQSDEEIDTTNIIEITTKLRSLHDYGVEIHKIYSLSSTDEVRDCVNKYGYLRKEAKELTEIAKNLKDFEYRLPLYPAAFSAFSCVFCGGTGDSCSDILKGVEKVEELLSKKGY